MADIIKLLPDHIANQIAAGEVVQRPASAVKELLENAIDAGGKNIKLIIKDAGKTLIQVIDDGVGMSETDARMSFERHATSKIRTAEEIYSIRTMGFRGEALASIAAVAQVELKSKQYNQELGTRIQIEGSEIISQEPCQASAGTSIMVKNLFYNIPARRIFLKADNIEMRHIIDEFQQIVLAHPDIFFSLHHNGDKIYHLMPGNVRQRIVGAFGPRSNHALIPIHEETDVIKISGFIGKPEFAKKMRGEQFFFVNSRFIKSSYLHHALMLAYEDLLQSKMYPMYVVFFEMDPSKIDVNVHPTKQEIKFEDERLVYNYLRVAARHALAQYSITPSLDFEIDQSNAIEFNRFSENTDNGEKENEGISTFESRLSSGIEKLSGLNYDSDEKTKFSGSSFKFSTDKNSRENTNLKNWEKLYDGLLTEGETADDKRDEQDSYISKIGNSNELEMGEDETYSVKQLFQIHNTYIISTLKSGFMLINQTAAHQRILYEDFLKRLELQEPLIQSKLFPTSIDLNPRDSEILMGILTELNALGIDIREFGKNCFVVHGLPAEMNDLNEQKLIEELIEQFQEGLTLKLDVKHNLARVLAMQAATRQGVKLNQDEMQRIVDRLFSCSDPFTAPNGKKTFIRIELSELQRRFE